MLRNNRPYSPKNTVAIPGGGTRIDDLLITDLPYDSQETVFNWIIANYIPRKTPNRKHSSYGMKQTLTGETGIYVTNNQFKDAMMICGYEPTSYSYKPNWVFCISERSPAFHR